jgi:CheY-like chemotaxis protein/CheY-specific phosphatase CheX
MVDIKVLVADDDYAIRNALKRTLRSLDCTAVEAADGAAALEALSQHAVRAAIIDLSMPLLSGLDVLRAVRANPGLIDFPVIVITGTADSDMAREVIRLGVADFLAKPFKPDQVKLRLRRVLKALQEPHGTFGEGHAANGIARAPDAIVIADGNGEFRHFVANALTPRPVIQASTGTEALRICMAARPAVVLVGSDLGIFGAGMLAQRIRRDPTLAAVKVGLVPSPDHDERVDRSLAQAVLARTFVAEAFAAEFEALLEGAFADGSGPFALVRETLIQATRQAIGMMAHTDISIIPDRRDAVVSGDIVGSVTLHIPDASSVFVTLSCGREAGNELAARLLGTPAAELTGEDAQSTVGELLNVIVGRVQGAVTATGRAARFTLPKIVLADQDDDPSAEADVVIHFDSKAHDLPIRVSLKAVGRPAARTSAAESAA